MYNNALDTSGKQVGYWLVNDNNQKQPLYFTLQNMYTAAAVWVSQFTSYVGRLPYPNEYQLWLVSHLEQVI